MFELSERATEEVENAKVSSSSSASAISDTQIFVRNLGYDCTSDDLAAVFEQYGPIKNISIAQKDGKSRGFGFVKYAFTEDARAAMEALQGTDIGGRSMTLERAIKVDNKSSSSKAEQKALISKLKESHRSAVSTKVKIMRNGEEKVASKMELDIDAMSAIGVNRSLQVVTYGVPKHLRKKMKVITNKLVRKSESQYINTDNPLHSLLKVVAPPGDINLVTLTSRKDAKQMAEKLHGKTVAQIASLCNEELPPDVNRKGKIVSKLFSDVTLEYLRKRKSRVIIRNLSFQATEENVMMKLLKFGPLVSVDIPRVAVTNTSSRKGKGPNDREEKLRPRGFGFATFLCADDAKDVVSNSAGLRVCNREVAIDFALSKDIYTREEEKEVAETEMTPSALERQIEESDRGIPGSEDFSEDQADGAINHEIETEEDSDNKDVHESDEISDGDDEDGSDEDGSDDDDDDDRDMDISEEVEQNGYDEWKDSHHKTKRDSDVNENCTLFIRGVPFDASDEDVKKAFLVYGKIETALVVRDKVSGMSKGTAFLKYATQESLKKCLNANIKEGGQEGTGEIEILDRKCLISIAVSKEEAQAMKEGKKIFGIAKDKRNLYLSNEGLAYHKDKKRARDKGKEKKRSEALEMSEQDRAKREHSQNEKKKKLQNPLYFVSATRLSIRNMNKKVNDVELKKMVMEATKRGIEKKLVSTADVEAQKIAQGKSRMGEVNIIPEVDKNTIKSHKVMLDNTRLRQGIPQSRGYAFVEFNSHVHALACLRELNNNKTYADRSIGGPSRLIVEFSLENAEKVQILREREKKRKRQLENAKVERERNMEDDDNSVSGRKKKKKMKLKNDNDNNDKSVSEIKSRVRREGPGKKRKRLKAEAAAKATAGDSST